MRESKRQADIREALGLEPDLVLWRNQVGVTREFEAKTGKERFITYGLQKGSADLVGVLSPHGRWFCLEIKTEAGRESDDQKRWARLMRSMGGFCATVRSTQDAREALERARRGEYE